MTFDPGRAVIITECETCHQRHNILEPCPARTVTVRKAAPRRGARVTLHFSALPDREFGPYPWGEAIIDLTISALLSRVDARSLVLDALATGEATTETGE